MVKIVCAPDSFKESMTAAQAAAAMARGVRRVLPAANVVQVPMADGGEGTLDALVSALDGQTIDVMVRDARSRPAHGRLGWVASKRLAIVEVAQACGLEALPAALRDPTVTTSIGVGDLILAALDRQAAEIVICLGGTATNDAGAGLLTRLGVSLLDQEGRPLPPGGAALLDLATVEVGNLEPRLARTRLTVASDVTNPLLGPTGASVMFGPQKGGSADQVALLERALTRWADVIEPVLHRSVRHLGGAGAAGGLGAALLGLGAEFRSGVEVVAELTGLRDQLQGADWVLTGEGRVDDQTAHGKTPWGVATLAAREGVRVLIFAGSIGPGAELLEPAAAIVPINPPQTPLAIALAQGAVNLEDAVAATLGRLASAQTS